MGPQKNTDMWNIFGMSSCYSLLNPKLQKKKKEMARDTIYCKIIPARVFFLFAHMLKCTLFMPNTQNNEYFLNTGPAG